MCCERTLYNLQGVYVNRIIYAFWLRMQAGLEKTRVFNKKKTQRSCFFCFFLGLVYYLFVHKKSVEREKFVLFKKKLKSKKKQKNHGFFSVCF